MLKNIKVLLIILVLFQNICLANPFWIDVVDKDAKEAKLDENIHFVFLADSRLENTSLINGIVEKAMDKNNRIYIECYIDFWSYRIFSAPRIPYKFLLNGEVDIHAVLNYEAYKNNLADIKNIYVNIRQGGLDFMMRSIYMFLNLINPFLMKFYIRYI
jgi:hypothetical protein